MGKTTYYSGIVTFLSILALTDSHVLDQLTTEIIYKPSDCNIKSKSYDFLTVHFTGTTSDGKMFHSSWEKNEPIEFQLRKGEVIRGFDEGLLDMCVGEKRKLTVPSNFAKHYKGNKIPAPEDSVLIYEIELLKIEKGTHPMVEAFRETDVNSDKQISPAEMITYLKNRIDKRNADGKDKEVGEGDRAMLKNPEKLAAFVFQEHDADQDGFISHDEFFSRWKDEL